MRPPPREMAGLIHHSDRGVQYVSIKYTERLAEAIDASVSEKRTNVGNNGVEPSDIADGIETEH